jgi:hypothetical protein
MTYEMYVGDKVSQPRFPHVNEEMYVNIEQDVFYFQKNLENNHTIYRKNCQCKECTECLVIPNMTLDRYIVMKSKSEMCECNVCCWCKYKKLYAEQPKRKTYQELLQEAKYAKEA